MRKLSNAAGGGKINYSAIPPINLEAPTPRLRRLIMEETIISFLREPILSHFSVYNVSVYDLSVFMGLPKETKIRVLEDKH